MKNSSSRFQRVAGAFTIIELLVVISIIGILAALLLPAVSRGIVTAHVKKAQTEEATLAQAIQSYYTTYSRYPVSSNALYFSTQASDDFTYGTTNLTGLNAFVANPTVAYNTNNSEVIAILMDLTTDQSGNNTVNVNHVKNPQQIKFLSATMSGNIGRPGVGPDLVYRDPWGNPYIISMDLNYDGKCRDAFYRQQKVSQQPTTPATPAGFNGLYNSTDPLGAGNTYEFNGGVMVWSFGPDGRADINVQANQTVNADNIISWK